MTLYLNPLSHIKNGVSVQLPVMVLISYPVRYPISQPVTRYRIDSSVNQCRLLLTYYQGNFAPQYSYKVCLINKRQVVTGTGEKKALCSSRKKNKGSWNFDGGGKMFRSLGNSKKERDGRLKYLKNCPFPISTIDLYKKFMLTNW